MSTQDQCSEVGDQRSLCLELFCMFGFNVHPGPVQWGRGPALAVPGAVLPGGGVSSPLHAQHRPQVPAPAQDLRPRPRQRGETQEPAAAVPGGSGEGVASSLCVAVWYMMYNQYI